MRKIILSLIIAMLFLSCKNSSLKTENSTLVTENKGISININDTIKASDSSQIIITKNDTLYSSSKKKETKTDVFLKQELIGLGIKDSLAIEPFKKYWIDFNSICYPSALSLYIDTLEKKIYAYDYAFYFENKRFSVDNINTSYIFHIESFNKTEDLWSFKINEIEYLYLEDNKSQFNTNLPINN